MHSQLQNYSRMYERACNFIKNTKEAATLKSSAFKKIKIHIKIIFALKILDNKVQNKNCFKSKLKRKICMINRLRAPKEQVFSV